MSKVKVESNFYLNHWSFWSIIGNSYKYWLKKKMYT